VLGENKTLFEVKLEKQKTERIEIEKLKKPNGAIGNQGVTETNVRDILIHVLGLNVGEELNMRDMVDLFKQNEKNINDLIDFTNKHPIKITFLPDESIHIRDGHHRAFLLDQAGVKDIAYSSL
jgi:hypothetical protein